MTMSAKSILIVDDDEAIVEVLEAILDEEGYTVLHAHSGSESIQIAKNSRPQLILLDLMLPDMHGTIVAERIRSEQDINHTPIVVISASHNVKEIVKTMKVQDYIE